METSLNTAALVDTPRRLARKLRGEPAAPASRTPADVRPEVRRPGFAFPADLPAAWWGGDPVRTLFLAALSATFPPGERLFIHSVRPFQDRLEDPELRDAVRRFVGQEAQHTKEHIAFNELLASRGVGVGAVEKRIDALCDEIRRTYSPERLLAHTVALEHFTALLSEEVLLKDDAVLADMDPRVAALWAWHAIEETEHKAVALDVYRAVGGSELLRLGEMLVVSVLFPWNTTLSLVQLMAEAGQLGNARAWLRAFAWFWIHPGVLRKVLPAYLRFFSPGFHPWDQDTRPLVERAKRRWLRGEAAG
jgi:hypothetical protein